MDLFGSCDAFAKVSWQGLSHQSEVYHDSLNPDWTESVNFEFPFPMRQVEGGGGGDLEIKVLDWDRLSTADEVGRITVSAAILKDLVRQQTFEHDEVLQDQHFLHFLLQHGKDADDPRTNRSGRYVGGDSTGERADCSVDHARAGDEEGNNQQEYEAEEERRKSGGGILEMEVLRADHLPQMDMFGSCELLCVACVSCCVWRDSFIRVT